MKLFFLYGWILASSSLTQIRPNLLYLALKSFEINSHLFPVNILGSLLSPSEKVRNLGVIFHSSFRFSAQVSSICSSSYYHIGDFARIRRYLDKPTAIAVANALVSSRLDYCNSLLNSISEYDLKRLNSIQYSLCRIVQRTSRFSREHMSPHLRSLHWLPVK